MHSYDVALTLHSIYLQNQIKWHAERYLGLTQE